MNPIREGDRVGNYILESQCGTGSFGQVWSARHHVFNERVALKIPTDPEFVRQLQREGMAIHGLRQINIVRALDLDPYGDPPYLVMELVNGPTLRAVIDDHPQGLPQPVATVILRGILEALKAAHEADIIHRDIKPANVMLDLGDTPLRDVNAGQVKVTDFGLGKVGGMTTASIMQSGNITGEQAEELSGTIAYMAPEQRDGLDCDHRCDLYACGVVLFEMLTGRRPQGSDLPSQINPDTSATFDDVFRRCHTARERRFGSAAEALAALGGAAPAAARAARSVSRCQACSGAVQTRDQFCIHCGHQLVDRVRRCHTCDAIAHPDDHYCIMCGTALDATPRPKV